MKILRNIQQLFGRFSNRPSIFWRNIGIFIASLMPVLGLIVFVWLSWVKAYGLVHPNRTTLYTTPDEFGIEFWEDVEFQTEDGLTLSAWFVPPKPEANGSVVILVSGLGGNRSGMIPDGVMLYEAKGIGFLALDLRNQGVSEGDITTMGLMEALDVHAAVDYLLTREDVGKDRIGILGHSMGASTVLIAAGQNPEIDAIVSITSFSSLEETMGESFKVLTGLPAFPFAPLTIYFVEQESGYDLSKISPISWVDDIAPRPILFIHGAEDELIPVSNAERLFAAAGEPKFI